MIVTFKYPAGDSIYHVVMENPAWTYEGLLTVLRASGHANDLD